MRAFTASQSESEADAMEAEDQHDLGAAAPAEKGHHKYLEEQKHKREKAKEHAKDREEKRKRSEEKVAQDISEEEEVDLARYKGLSEMTPEDFHKVMLQQSREIKELKKDKHRQGETNAAFSKVITAQSAAQKKFEEASVLYNYEFTGLPRDDSEEC